jgi:DNA replication and repair protein RecN
MLLELNISDFAIIERLNLRFCDGFNVLTGETGAGKSIIIDALGTLRGERTDPSFVRAGSERARVEGIFSIADRPDLLALLDEYGLRDDDDQVILSREIIRESGRSVARVNGRAVSSAVLRDIGSRLVDIHGQHEGLSLFNSRTHGEMLDRFGGLIPLRERVAAQVAALRQVRDELDALRRAAQRRTERIQELTFLLEDVRAARLRPGEEEELLRERALLQNGARITELVATTYALLYTGDETGRRAARSAVELLGAINDALTELARLDPTLSQAAEQATELLYSVEDLATRIRAYRDSMEFDPARLDAIEDRLTLIRDMQRKYRGSIEHILERAASAEGEIERLTRSAEHLADLEAKERHLLDEIGRLASELSQRRREAVIAWQRRSNRRRAISLSRMCALQSVWNAPKTREGVPITENGVERRWSFDRSGIDTVEFLLSPNPGEPLKPLARIASGGESARLLLALKSILSRVDDIPTLVFDEIDVGVGGRAGQVVGEKLWSISDRHQVICITHLPQVAAFADAHYAIAKLFSDGRTRTVVEQLDDAKRAHEIAAMLDGTPVSEHSLRSALDMLERARAYKQRTDRNLSPDALHVEVEK